MDNKLITASLIASSVIVSSVLVFRGYGDSYTLWLLSNLVNIALWFTAFTAGYSASALPMLLTIAFYTVTSIYGRFISVWSGKTNV